MGSLLGVTLRTRTTCTGAKLEIQRGHTNVPVRLAATITEVPVPKPKTTVASPSARRGSKEVQQVYVSKSNCAVKHLQIWFNAMDGVLNWTHIALCYYVDLYLDMP